MSLPRSLPVLAKSERTHDTKFRVTLAKHVARPAPLKTEKKLPCAAPYAVPYTAVANTLMTGGKGKKLFF